MVKVPVKDLKSLVPFLSVTNECKRWWHDHYCCTEARKYGEHELRGDRLIGGL